MNTAFATAGCIGLNHHWLLMKLIEADNRQPLFGILQRDSSENGVHGGRGQQTHIYITSDWSTDSRHYKATAPPTAGGTRIVISAYYVEAIHKCSTLLFCAGGCMYDYVVVSYQGVQKSLEVG